MKVYEKLHKRFDDCQDIIFKCWDILDSDKEQDYAEAKCILREAEKESERIDDEIICGDSHIEPDGYVYTNEVLTPTEAQALGEWLIEMFKEVE